MKISELTTEKAADILCEITPYAANITTDTGLSEALKGTLAKGANVAELYQMGAQKITKIVPILLKDHRDDVFSVLAVLNGSTVDTVREQNIMVTMSQIRELFQDKDLLNFFKSQQPEGAKE